MFIFYVLPYYNKGGAFLVFSTKTLYLTKNVFRIKTGQYTSFANFLSTKVGLRKATYLRFVTIEESDANIEVSVVTAPI